MEDWDAAEEAALSQLEARFEGEGGRPAPPGVTAAAAGVREGVRRGTWPLDWAARAAGWREPPPDDAALLRDLVAGLVAPEEATGLDEDGEAVLLLLQPADWAAVAEHCLDGGASAPSGVDALVSVLAADAAAEGEPLTEQEQAVAEAGLGLVVPVLVAAGLLDADERLTPVGEWALPRGVARGLGGDLDGRA